MITKELENTLNLAIAEATKRQHEYVTLEHLLLALLADPTARDVIYSCGGNLNALKKEIEEFFAAHEEMVSPDLSTLPEQTIAFQQVLQYALLQAQASEQRELNGGGVLAAL
ncbi:MAG TPA: Clp protease N-terminal domain-containing protein, partial [Pyrinomonadaceae bacterium]|nr:Clp protease N-terminal domain-containing protein [Pyrinomonadaceae bacterium]